MPKPIYSNCPPCANRERLDHYYVEQQREAVALNNDPPWDPPYTQLIDTQAAPAPAPRRQARPYRKPYKAKHKLSDADRAWLTNTKSCHGFTAKQLGKWGVPWPPPAGWKKALIRGRPIPKRHR
jgi:hypothetical protein